MHDRIAYVLLWPWWQRLFHWLLASGVLIALLTHHGGNVHEVAGYAVAIIAGVRLILGLLGPPALRFTAFVRGWRSTVAYAFTVWHGTEPRHLNHNPLGAWMVVALLLLALSGALVGWLYTTDRFWGMAWVINLHALLTWPFVGLIALHIAGVIHASVRHRENLVAAMLHGYKRIEKTNREGDRSR